MEVSWNWLQPVHCAYVPSVVSREFQMEATNQVSRMCQKGESVLE